MIIFGLTGGIACGKSTVANILRDIDVAVIDADQVARKIVQPDQPALQEIVDHFGPEILLANGSLHRKKLGAIIMADKQSKTVLEQITHPKIHQEIQNELLHLRSLKKSCAVIEAALMVENGSFRQYHGLIVVTCTPHVQLSRLQQRDNYNEQRATKWIASQLPLKDKEQHADWLIRNDGSQAELRTMVVSQWPDFVRKFA